MLFQEFLYSGNFNGAIPNYYNYQRVKNGILDTATTYATTQTVDDAIDWMESNPEASKEEYAAKHKAVEQVANPIIRRFYSRGDGDPKAQEDMSDFEDDEL